MTFHLPGDKLTCTSTIEHAIPTPTLDPHRAINVKSYRMPEIHKEEVQKQTEQLLADGVIKQAHEIFIYLFPRRLTLLVR